MTNALPSAQNIEKYFRDEKILFSKHFIQEMQEEELGGISVDELIEASVAPEIIKEYPEDKPYPSMLILGFTKSGRPLHFVCARDEMRDVLVLITIYEPRIELWADHRRRIL